MYLFFLSWKIWECRCSRVFWKNIFSKIGLTFALSFCIFGICYQYLRRWQRCRARCWKKSRRAGDGRKIRKRAICSATPTASNVRPVAEIVGVTHEEVKKSFEISRPMANIMYAAWLARDAVRSIANLERFLLYQTSLTQGAGISSWRNLERFEI